VSFINDAATLVLHRIADAVNVAGTISLGQAMGEIMHFRLLARATPCRPCARGDRRAGNGDVVSLACGLHPAGKILGAWHHCLPDFLREPGDFGPAWHGVEPAHPLPSCMVPG
jgi:hypothetical protein